MVLCVWRQPELVGKFGLFQVSFYKSCTNTTSGSSFNILFVQIVFSLRVRLGVFKKIRLRYILYMIKVWLVNINEVKMWRLWTAGLNGVIPLLTWGVFVRNPLFVVELLEHSFLLYFKIDLKLNLNVPFSFCALFVFRNMYGEI